MRRGEVYDARLDPVEGSEQSGSHGESQIEFRARYHG